MKKNRWHNTDSDTGSDIKKCFADNNDDSRKNEMLYNVKLEV